MKIDRHLTQIVDRRLSDAAFTPHDAARVWQALDAPKPKAPRRRLSLVMAMALILVLIAAVAIAISALYPVAETVMDMEQAQGEFATWNLDEQLALIEAMKEEGIDTSMLPDISGMTRTQANQALDAAITQMFPSELATLSSAILENAWGFYDTWTLEQKAWYSHLLDQHGRLGASDMVNILPDEQAISQEAALATAGELLMRQYGITSDEMSQYSAYAFFGYSYGAPEDKYWLLHYRDPQNGNVLSMTARLGQSGDPDTAELWRIPSRYELDQQASEQEKRVVDQAQLREQMEAEQGPMITWSLEDKAKIYDGYGVPPTDGMQEPDAIRLAREAILARYPSWAGRVDQLTAYAYYSIDEPAPLYTLNFFEDANDLNAGTVFSVEINAETGEIVNLYTTEDSHG